MKLEAGGPGSLKSGKLCPGGSIRWAPANILRWGRDAGAERELKDAKREAKKTQRRAKRKPKEVKGANGWPEDQKTCLNPSKKPV